VAASAEWVTAAAEDEAGKRRNASEGSIRSTFGRVLLSRSNGPYQP